MLPALPHHITALGNEMPLQSEGLSRWKSLFTHLERCLVKFRRVYPADSHPRLEEKRFAWPGLPWKNMIYMGQWIVSGKKSQENHRFSHEHPWTLWFSSSFVFPSIRWCPTTVLYLAAVGHPRPSPTSHGPWINPKIIKHPQRLQMSAVMAKYKLWPYLDNLSPNLYVESVIPWNITS